MTGFNVLTLYQPCRLRPDCVEHRNGGGQILFIEFCDWAIKKQLGNQEDGSAAAPRAKGGEAGQGLSAAPEAVTPSAAARSTRPRSATRDRPARATPLAVSKSQEYGGIIEKHSDYRCGDVLWTTCMWNTLDWTLCKILPTCLIQRAGREASDWEERVGQGAAEQNLPAVRSQREWIPVSSRDRQGRARRARPGCESEHCFCLL